MVKKNTNQAHPAQYALAAIQKNEQGDITEFRTNTGDTLSYSEAIEFAKQGRIVGVEVFQNNGKEELRAEDDGIEGNLLERLPDFHHLTNGLGI